MESSKATIGKPTSLFKSTYGLLVHLSPASSTKTFRVNRTGTLDQCSQSRHAVDGGMDVVRGNDYDLRMVFLRCTAGPQDGCDKHHRVKTGKEFHHWFFTQ
ncbi:MAG: hypothetical protein ACLR8Y_12590 [Alistipes indistinctus]